jgi:hypothetical protein
MRISTHGCVLVRISGSGASSSGYRFFCVPQIAPDFPDARLIQASAGVQHDLLSQVGGALSLTPGDDQDGRWGDTFVPRGHRVWVRVRIWGWGY